MEWSPKMAKKPMTKAQIVSHFAKKFELTRKTASGILDEVAALAVSEIGARRGWSPWLFSFCWRKRKWTQSSHSFDLLLKSFFRLKYFHLCKIAGTFINFNAILPRHWLRMFISSRKYLIGYAFWENHADVLSWLFRIIGLRYSSVMFAHPSEAAACCQHI